MKAYTRELLRAKLLELTKLQREHDQTGAFNELDAFLEDLKDAFGRLRSPISAIVANVQSEIQSCIEGKETDQMKATASSRKRGRRASQPPLFCSTNPCSKSLHNSMPSLLRWRRSWPKRWPLRPPFSPSRPARATVRPGTPKSGNRWRQVRTRRP